jgi:hypothetical protein
VVGAKGRRTDDAQRKRREREASDRKWAQLDDMFPATHSARSGNRAKALRSGPRTFARVCSMREALRYSAS